MTPTDFSAPSMTTDQPWHALLPEAAAARLDATLDGLDGADAAARLRHYGPNILELAPRKPLLAIVFGQLRSPLIYLLLVAAAISVLLGDIADAAFICVILLINSTIGAIQEARADLNTVALRRTLRTTARVRRDGAVALVDSSALVPGDVVLLEAGDRVAADLRLLDASDLQVNESALTGESMPVEKQARVHLAEQTPLADRLNLLFAGTLVQTGRGSGLVVATGAATQLGRIAHTLAGPPTAPPLTGRLDAFTRLLGMLVIVLVMVAVAPRLLLGAPLAESLMIAVALAVAIIPEGLPVAVTVALSVATRRMARRNVIVRHLPAVEGLGACTVIATDKTGTLTINQLTAERVWLPGTGVIDLSAAAPAATDRAGQHPLLGLGRSASLCNDAWLDADGAGSGDTVDLALLRLAARSAIEIDSLRSSAPRLDERPFSAERRYAATLNRHDDGHVLHAKGAPEVIVPLCTIGDGSAILQHAETMAEAGYRVLAIATKPLAATAPGTLDDELCDMTLLGLVGFIDPLRPEARAAVADCRSAGVAVKMITGDHPGTALAIARQLGLAATRGEVVTAAELRAAGSDAERRRLVAASSVFARVEPSQKVQIVDDLRAAGHVVAMTGDGVNDAPALARADIGVAMGRDGTDVARDAADLVLADDNFASIVAGVEEGRAAYANIRKVLYLLISTGAAEAMAFLLSVVTGLPLPLTAVQLLWLNLVTNGGQDVALAFERPEPDLLRRPPRRPDEPLVDGVLLRQTLVSGLYMGTLAFAVFAFALAQGMPEVDARNLLLFVMVLFENVHAFNVRSETRSAFAVPLSSNWPLVSAVAGAQLLHLLSPFVPVLRDVLQVRPIDPATWLLLLLVAISLLLVMEVDKAARRRRHGRLRAVK